MTSYIVSVFSKIGMMAAVVAASLFPTSLSAQDVAGCGRCSGTRAGRGNSRAGFGQHGMADRGQYRKALSKPPITAPNGLPDSMNPVPNAQLYPKATHRIVLWVILAYFPMAHWVWGGGFLQRMGAIDFAGGTVVHINAGISALVMAIMLGKREDYRIGHPVIPHNVAFVFMGTSFLWLGWFGFNAGSGLAADGLAANAFLVTHVGNGRRGGYLDGDGLDMQQEADYRRRVHGSRGRTGGDHSGRRHGRSAGRILYRADYAGRLLFHGGRHQTEVQV